MDTTKRISPWVGVLIGLAVEAAGLGVQTLWPDQRFLGISLLVIGAVLLVVALIVLWRSRISEFRWLPMWHIKCHVRLASWLPFRRLLPLGDASQRAYERLDLTKWGSIAAGLVEQLGDKPLSYFHQLVGMNVQVYGVRPPSREFRKIDPNEFKSGRFSDDGNTFQRYNETRNAFENLMVQKRELKRFIADWRAKYEQE